MVKGITRQVIVVKAPDQKLFDQAIFLVREDAVAEGGITEEALLKEAKIVCKNAAPRQELLKKLLWAACGAIGTGLFWLLTTLI